MAGVCVSESAAGTHDCCVGACTTPSRPDLLPNDSARPGESLGDGAYAAVLCTSSRIVSCDSTFRNAAYAGTDASVPSSHSSPLLSISDENGMENGGGRH